jgi:hypothetical protein
MLNRLLFLQHSDPIDQIRGGSTHISADFTGAENYVDSLRILVVRNGGI